MSLFNGSILTGWFCEAIDCLSYRFNDQNTILHHLVVEHDDMDQLDYKQLLNETLKPKTLDWLVIIGENKLTKIQIQNLTASLKYAKQRLTTEDLGDSHVQYQLRTCKNNKVAPADFESQYMPFKQHNSLKPHDDKVMPGVEEHDGRLYLVLTNRQIDKSWTYHFDRCLVLGNGKLKGYVGYEASTPC